MSASLVSARLLSAHIGCEIAFDLTTQPNAAQLAGMQALFVQFPQLEGLYSNK